MNITYCEPWRLAPYFVYRYYNDDAPEGDQLLYVGMTRNPRKRDQIHRSSSRWYEDVTRYEVAQYSDQITASGVESRAIGDEAPVYNVQGNHKRYAAAMAQLAENAAELASR